MSAGLSFQQSMRIFQATSSNWVRSLSSMGWAWRWPDRERKPERFVVITLSILGSAMDKLPSSALQRKHLPASPRLLMAYPFTRMISTTRNSPQLKIAYMACWYIQPCPCCQPSWHWLKAEQFPGRNSCWQHGHGWMNQQAIYAI